MCGIAGVLAFTRDEVEQPVHRMMDAMVRRGPDDHGLEVIGPNPGTAQRWLGLGFRRLAIIDLTAAGHQPMKHPVTGDCLVFNGEIYNFKPLREHLEKEGCRFRGGSDSEVLLHALVAWGEAALPRLQGMFAFAFWKANERRLLLARDPLGIKPLYLANAEKRLVFASSVRALLASGLVRSDVDRAGVAGMLAYGAMQGQRTIFADIRSFPAGHAAWVAADQEQPTISPRPFWRCPAPQPQGEARTAPETIRSLVQNAVASHLVADVPVGVFLSAGIDSTVIAACAAAQGSDVTAFTVGIGEQYPEDEAEIARATAQRLGIRHIVTRVTTDELERSWGAWIRGLDSPSIDGFNTFIVSGSLAAEGIKVGLSGLGADELFGGYPIFRRAPRLVRLVQAVSRLPAPLRSSAVALLSRLGGRADMREKFADLLRGPADTADIVLGFRRVLADKSLAALGFAPGMGRGRDALDLADQEQDAELALDDFNVVSRTELRHYMRDMLLRDTDANSMHHSLEVRVPFLHQPLVDYVLRLPGCVKRGPRDVPKYLLRAAFHDEIGPTVSRRRKTGFTLPIGDWLRGPMRDMAEAALEALCDVPGMRRAAVNEVWNAFLDQSRPIHWSRPFALVATGAYLDSTIRSA